MLHSLNEIVRLIGRSSPVSIFYIVLNCIPRPQRERGQAQEDHRRDELDDP